MLLPIPGLRLLRRGLRRVALALTGGALGCGAGGDPAPRVDVPVDGSPCGMVGESAQAIVKGSLDDADPAVVAVNTLDVDCQRAGAPACTGTLIAPDQILTAAHCVGGSPPESFVVLFGATSDPGWGPLGLGLEGALFRVDAIRVSPAFDAASLAHDLAILHLESPATAPPVPRVTAPLQGPIEGIPARIVGFGDAKSAPANAKRSGNVIVTDLSADDIRYGPDPSMACDGDSGGPVLVMVGGEEQVWGVTSRGDVTCVDHGIAARADAADGSFWDAPF